MAVKPEPARRFIKGDILASLGSQLAEQNRLLQAVQACLPEFLASHCRHCVPKGERLLIYADTPAFASQLRFYGPSLLARLEEITGRRFREFQVRNLLSVMAPPKSKPPPALQPPTSRAVKTLRDGAANSPDEIGEALLRLSRTLLKASGTEP
ncbi:DciA family protein [Methylomagnum sp.]